MRARGFKRGLSAAPGHIAHKFKARNELPPGKSVEVVSPLRGEAGSGGGPGVRITEASVIISTARRRPYLDLPAEVGGARSSPSTNGRPAAAARTSRSLGQSDSATMTAFGPSAIARGRARSRGAGGGRSSRDSGGDRSGRGGGSRAIGSPLGRRRRGGGVDRGRQAGRPGRRAGGTSGSEPYATDSPLSAARASDSGETRNRRRAATGSSSSAKRASSASTRRSDRPRSRRQGHAVRLDLDARLGLAAVVARAGQAEPAERDRARVLDQGAAGRRSGSARSSP